MATDIFLKSVVVPRDHMWLPLAPPPDGNISRAYIFFATVLPFTGLSVILYLLRFFVRYKGRRKGGISEDILLTASIVCSVQCIAYHLFGVHVIEADFQIFAISGTTLICVATRYGLGRHQFYTAPEDARVAAVLV